MESIRFPTRHEMFNSLVKYKGSIIKVFGTYDGERQRQKMNGSGLRPQIVLAPVWIAGILVDHVRIDVTRRLLETFRRSKICIHKLQIGDRVEFEGIVSTYIHRKKRKIGVRGP